MVDLTVDKIGDLAGGLFRTQVNDALATIKADLDDRGNDGKERVLKLTISFKREVARDEDSVVIDPEVIPKLPSYRPMTTIGKVKIQAGEPVLLFQEHVPSNPDQPAMKFEDGPPDAPKK